MARLRLVFGDYRTADRHPDDFGPLSPGTARSRWRRVGEGAGDCGSGVVHGFRTENAQNDMSCKFSAMRKAAPGVTYWSGLLLLSAILYLHAPCQGAALTGRGERPVALPGRPC